MAPTEQGLDWGVGALRALHLCTRFLRGGSERRLIDIVRALPDVEHHLVVGRDSDFGLAKAAVPAARHIHEPSLVREVSPGLDLIALGRTLRLLRRQHFDVVYTHQSKAGAIGRLAASLSGVPSIQSLSMASFGPGYSRLEDTMFRLVERTLGPLTSACAVVGRDLVRRYQENGFPPEKLHVIRSGARIPSEDLSPRAAREALTVRFGIAENRPVIAYLGSLDRRKNVLSLPEYLTALKELTPRRPFLLIAGEGPLAPSLAESLEASGHSGDAKLIGFISPIDEVLVGADAIVLLSSVEGMPQILLQAAAAGTPFVSYAVDGVAELLELGASGTSVPLYDLEQAALATLSYLGRERDDTGHDLIPSTLRTALAEWSLPVITRAHRELLEGVLGVELRGVAANSELDLPPGQVA